MKNRPNFKLAALSFAVMIFPLGHLTGVISRDPDTGRLAILPHHDLGVLLLGEVPPSPPALTWVTIPAGIGRLGASPAKEGGADVVLVNFPKDFLMLETEVTNRQYAGWVPDHSPINDRPVDNRSWAEAQAWCKKAGGRLPTQMEWEYAARAGGDGLYGRGSDGEIVTVDTVEEYAWRPSREGMASVRLKKPNAFGLYDMWGNAMEWTADAYLRGQLPLATRVDPAAPPSAEPYVYDAAVLDVSGGEGPVARVTMLAGHLNNPQWGSSRTAEGPLTGGDLYVGFRCVIGAIGFTVTFPR